jgi:pyruvate dehydrogenase E2 component (dihydrolipoamide acetyltransferase)
MFEFELPDVGEGVAEGELVRWLVEPGDHVEEDEVLAEVETDKAVVDLPSPVAGTVRELHAEEGEMVPVGDVVVTIDTDEEAAAGGAAAGDADTGADTEPDTETDDEGTAVAEAGDAPAEPSANGDTGEASTADGRVFAPPNVRRLARELGVDIASVEGSGPGGRVTEADVRAAGTESGSDDATVEAAIESADEGTEAGADASGDEGSSGRKSAVRRVGGGDEQQSATSKSSSHEGTEAADRERTLAAPATRRLADEEGVDIDTVPTEKTRDGEPYVEPADVRAYAEAQQAAQAADAAAVGETEPAAGDGEATPADAETEALPVATETDEDVTREPYRGIRRTIGQQMERSKYTAPHVSHHDTAVVPDLVETRADLKGKAEQQGISLTYLPFVMKAVVAGLKEYPILNSTLDEDNEEILVKHHYNVGVAVATDAGLMVPVVENVDEKGLLQLASETAELTERARDRSLAREEMQGGTFTITNFGAIGGEYATPIINYPETAILGLGSIEQRPTVVDDEAAEPSRKGSSGSASTGEVVARHTLPLSLSIDHRVIDGAEAAQFANTVIEYLENPRLLLLE